MKKIFQNLALAGFTIAGIFASSCKIEDIKTVFEPSKAQATITVSAFDALNGNADISTDSDLKITASSNANNVIQVSGNVITIEGGPAIQEQIVTIDAEYKSSKGQTTVNVKSLLAGGRASYGASVHVGVAQQIGTAFVQLSVWDRATKKDVTAESTFTPSGVPEAYTCKAGESKGSFVITGDGGISAFDFVVKAKYGTDEAEATVKIDNIAKFDSKTYAASIEVGTEKAVPAVANIHVSVIDGLTQADVTGSSTITASLASGSQASCKVENGVVVVTAGSSNKIDAQTVTIKAKYNNQEKSIEFNLAEVAEGKVVNHNTSIIFKAPEMKATAVVHVSVWDNRSNTDVTASAELSYTGVPQGYDVQKGNIAGSYVITNSADIAAFEFKVTAKYNDATAEATVNVGAVKNLETKIYTAYIELGEVTKIPAVAKIHITVIDGTLQKNITEKSTITVKLAEDSKATAVYDESKYEVVVTAGSTYEIEAQKIAVTAKYHDIEKTNEISLSNIAEGVVVEFSETIIIKDPSLYYIEKVKETSEVEVGTFISSHNLHTYTHDYGHDYGHGHESGQWMYNETEFILETTIDYTDEYGTIGTAIEFAKGVTVTDMAMADYYSDGLAVPYVKKPAKLEVQVSAFARYSAYGTRTVTKTEYHLKRINPESGEEVVVATIIILNVNVQAEYCEAAIPGHEGHYEHGHGHTDEHGYSSNAGGGIIWAE